MNFVFSKEHQREFRNDLCIDYTKATWNGKNKEELVLFWDFVFPHSEVSVSEVFSTFSVLLNKINSGPIYNWLCWLQQKLCWFCFRNLNYSIRNILSSGNLSVEKVTFYLRDEASKYFDDSEAIDDFFSIISTRKEKLEERYENLLRLLNIDEKEFNLSSTKKDPFFSSLEVTVFSDWKRMIKFINGHSKSKKSHYLSHIFENEKLTKLSINYVAMLLFLVALIFSIKKITEFNEQTIFTKLKVPIPTFAWLKEGLFDQDKTEIQLVESIAGELNLDEGYGTIEEVVSEDNIERFDTESDVILTSIDSLPRSFEGLDLTSNTYEERRKGGFRDTRFGNRKVYRIMMKTTDTILVKSKIKEILETFQAEKSDRVEPGKFVPGGLYYNLFVPTKYLKQFIFNVNQVANSTIYLNKSRAFNPRGMSKVFLWVKKI